MPWTNEAANSISNNGPTPKPAKGEKAVAGKKLTEDEMKRLKATLFKPVSTNGGKSIPPSSSTKPEPSNQSAEKKKGFFGLF